MTGYVFGRRARHCARRAGLVELVSSILVGALALAGCGTGASGSVAPSAEPSEQAAEFALEVIPANFVGMIVSGQRAVLLVTVSGDEADGPVEIAATAEGATVTVDPEALAPGVVGEVTVVPAATEAETPITVTITASRGGVEQSEERTITTTPGEDTLAEEAALHLAPFVDWLEANHPELGITAETEWDGGLGSWVLIVEHYQYVSEDWELGLAWHVMTPPDDWARIYLRHRWTETEPAMAFEISSFSGGSEPTEIAPEGIWR